MAICSVSDSNNSSGSNRFTVALHKNKYKKGCLVVTFLHYCCFTKTTSYASGSEKLLAMYQKSPPKVLY